MGSDWDAPWKSFDGVKVVTGGASFTGDGMGKGFKALPSYTGSPNPCCQNCGGTQRGGDRKGFSRCKCDAPTFPNVRAKQMRAFQAWCEAWATDCYRILKPGGVIKVFSGTRTFHRVVKALRNTGFVDFDIQAWMYGSGFPKSLDVSKAIDKAAGAEREVVGQDTEARSTSGKSALPTVGGKTVYQSWDITAPATDAARQWSGYGTALKPAWEPIIVARKPE
jgi:site-specific DNA-methyltransferase (adenine-specific)